MCQQVAFRNHNGGGSDRTIGACNRPRGPNRTDGLRVGAVGELEPIVRVRLQVLGLDLECKVNVVARKGITGVDGPSRQVRVVENLERHADGNALVRESGSDGNSARPQEDGGVEGVTL